MLRRLVLILVATLLLCPGLQAASPKRQATLIGNKGYTDAIGRLTNPHNDVALLKSALEKLDFTVVVAQETDQSALLRTINGHVRRVREAGTGAIGFLYYSGHGALNPATNANYLIPVDVKDAEDDSFWDGSVQLTYVTDMLKKQASDASHFVIFDACRNNLKLKSKDRKAIVQAKGFVPVNEVSGMLIAYATAQGELASDQGEGAGPYARLLSEEILKPGIEAVTMFRNVQTRMRRDTTLGQEPWLNFNGLDETWFAGPAIGSEPSMDGARQHLRLDNRKSAKDMFEALAAKGNTEAMQALADMAVAVADTSGMLEWTKRAADVGDTKAKLALAWFAAARSELGDLPKAWESRLTEQEARRSAQALYQAGLTDAALVLQATLDNSDWDKPLKIAPELQAEVDRGHPGALTVLGRLLADRSNFNDIAKPNAKLAFDRAAQLLARAAASHEPKAVHWLIDDAEDPALRVYKATFMDTPSLAKASLHAIAAQPIEELLRGGPLQEILRTNATSLSWGEASDLYKHAINALQNGVGTPVDLARALQVSDDLIALRERIHKGARRGSISELRRARRRKADVLVAMRRPLEAIDLLLTNNSSDDLAAMIKIGETTGWPQDSQPRVLAAYANHCAELSFGEEASTMTECELAGYAMISAKRPPAVAQVHKGLRDWLEPKDRAAPTDDAPKGRALLMLARIVEIDPALLHSGETTAQLYTLAARLGAKEAATWLRDNGHPIPPMVDALRVSEEVIHDSDNQGWQAIAIKEDNKVRSCRANSRDAILTRSMAKDRRAASSVLYDGGTQLVGQVVVNMGVASIDPATVRLFVGRDEFVAPVTVADQRVTIGGDQAPLIVRLANAAMLRIEYRAANRNGIDVFSLDGFTNAYRAMLKSCPGMQSAFAAPAAPPAPSVPVAVLPPTRPATRPTVPAKAPLPTPRPPQAIATALVKQANKYFEGDGYKTLIGATYDQCASACSAEAQCVAIEFQRANATCQLYNKGEPILPAQGTDVGLKQ